MPDMNGFEVSLHIRETFPDWITIIFLSSHEEPEMIAKAIEAEKIQEALYFLDYPHAYSSVVNGVTVSRVVFALQPTGKDKVADLYATADRALYTSKSLGRNTYTVVNAC